MDDGAKAGADAERDAAEAQESLDGEAGSDCIVVGVGASAGGLEVLKRFLRLMPGDTGMAFVLMQHLDPTHESLMSELLGKHTSMPVLEINATTEVSADHVYVLPPNAYVSIHGCELRLDRPVKEKGVRMPIDHFFRSLAQARKSRAACVVLSGTGSDGSQGVREVKASGGLTLAQSPDSAEYDGMPMNAIKTGMVDQTGTIERIVKILTQYSEHPYPRMPRVDETDADESPDGMESVLRLLRSHDEYDFHCYKSGTLSRRVLRRMGIQQIHEPERYAAYLREEPGELRHLFKDLLIGVTRFFRDPEAWEVLQNRVLKKLVKRGEAAGPLRVWIPGCSTGEEVYSVAIALQETFAKHNTRFRVQIFGSDLDEDAIQTARAGIYPANIVADVSQDRLRRCFQPHGDGYRVAKTLRDSCVFAVQNIVSDPPFSQLDLICCRNLMIYLEPEIQQKLFRLFHFALRDDGYLFLGGAESALTKPRVFEPVSKSKRIFQKSHTSEATRNPFPVVASNGGQRSRASGRDGPRKVGTTGLVDIAQKGLLNAFVPASAVVDAEAIVHYFHGPVRDFLDIPAGVPTTDLMEMVARPLRLKVCGLLKKSVRDGAPASGLVTGVEIDDDRRTVRVSVLPISDARAPKLWVVTFDVEAAITRSRQEGGEEARIPEEVDDDILKQLEFELYATREDLQSSIEQLETSNEELKASNEEVMSMNEELQSANQELESSREELQSINEELSTVNAELQEKIGELEASNNDLANLLNSTELATIFLDTEFNIRRFTPACRDLLNVIDSDIGRPIADLTSRANDTDLLEDASRVLEKLVAIERRVEPSEDGVYVRRVLPYRTSANRIEGVVVTYTDVSSLEEAHRQVRVREQQQSVIASVGRSALTADDFDGFCGHTLELVAETLGVPLAKVLRLLPNGSELLMTSGIGWQDGLAGRARVPNDQGSQAGYTLAAGTPVIVSDLREESRFQGPALLIDHGVVSGMSVVIGPQDDPWGVLGMHATEPREFTVDDTNFVQAIANIIWAVIDRSAGEAEQAQRLAEIEALYTLAPVGLSLMDRDLRYIRINRQLADINGVPVERHLGRTFHEVLPELAEGLASMYERVHTTGEAITDHEVTGTTHAEPGELKHWLLQLVPFEVDGEVQGVHTAVLDITERKRIDRQLREQTELLRIAKDAADIGVFTYRFDDQSVTIDGRVREIWGIPDTGDQPWSDLLHAIHEDDRDDVEAAIARSTEPSGDGRYICQYRVTHRETGEVRWVQATGMTSFRDEKPVRMIGSVIDISENKATEAKLMEWGEQLEERVAERTLIAERRAESLRLLASQIGDVERKTRQRIASLIHDELQQLMVAAKMRLPQEEGLCTPDQVTIVRDLLDQALSTSRTLVSELSPPVLHDGSLSEALEWLVKNVKEQHDLKAELECDPDLEMDRHVKAIVFESVRELLFNVVKHAEIASATVSVECHDGTVVVRVSDVGRGFDSDQVGEQKGFGLFSVRERMASIGGELAVRSARGEGTDIELRIPHALIRSADDAGDAGDLFDRAGLTTPSRGSPIRLLIADDHKIMRQGLVSVFNADTGIEVVGEAADGRAAVDMARALSPDVVIMDISMPELNGVEATAEIRRTSPRTVVIVLSLHDRDEMGPIVKRAGASAFLNKDIPSGVLIETIRMHMADRAGSASVPE